MTRVVSFDVFDTVLTRLTGSPDQVFVATGRRLRLAAVIDVAAEVYAAARREAVQDLTSDIAEHPTLDNIAVEVTSRLGLQSSLAADFVAAELEVEREICRAMPGAASRVERGRKDSGRGAVFISDTSMPTAFLRELLAREDLFHDGDVLYTSAECRASKQHGGLFDVVAADLGVAPRDIRHVGDDRTSDLANARLHGWSATLDSDGRFTGRERRMDAEAAATEGLGPQLAAAARLGRLAAADEGVDPALAAVAGGVALPLLAGFGLWVLRQAELLQLDRLYFVSRDGEVFRDVTRRLAEQLGIRIECRYLYGSRKSWQLASAGRSTYDGSEGLWLADEAEAETLSARAVLTLVDLTPAVAHALTGLALFTPERVDEILGEVGWGRLRQVMAAEPLVGEIRRRARVRRDLLVGYLDQEGVTGPGRVGLVDVGWTGRAARSLEDVLVDVDRPRPAVHLFLGLLGNSPQLMGSDLLGRSRGWLIDEARGRGSRARADEDPVMLIESFAMGSEGHTAGYVAEGSQIRPDLVAARNPAADRWAFNDYRRALELSVEALTAGPPLDTHIDLRPLVWRQILDLWRTPSRSEASVWGAQPYGEDFGNAASHPLATPVTTLRMLTRLGIGKAAWREPTYWLAGTLALSPAPWRLMLTLVARTRRLTRRAAGARMRVRQELAVRRGA